eukprot:1019480-Heterocapsa_arctica.AAC.1
MADEPHDRRPEVVRGLAERRAVVQDELDLAAPLTAEDQLVHHVEEVEGEGQDPDEVRGGANLAKPDLL